MSLCRQLFRLTWRRSSRGHGRDLRRYGLGRASSTRLSVEALETRLVPSGNELAFVIPLSQPSDFNHVYTLADAMNIAEIGGTVIIEPGATRDPGGPVRVGLDGITIQGDSNVPASSLPQYELEVHAVHVTLTNLNLRSVQFGSAPGDTGVFSNTVSKCIIQDLTEFGRTSTFTQNTITGNARFQNDGLHGGDVIANNTFRGLRDQCLYIVLSDGIVVTQNTFLPGSDGDGIYVFDSGHDLPVTIADNTIAIFTGPAAAFAISVNLDEGDTIRILNNTMNTNNVGVGLRLISHSNMPFNVLVQGNDFHDNRVGVEIVNGFGGVDNIDLGGGSLGSLGDNDFRGFTMDAGPSAILLTDAVTATIAARQNLFRAGVDPSAVVSSSVDTSSPLSNERAFVQTLYNEVLGRTGTLAELDPWVQLLVLQGQAAVANGILHSNEALGRIVDAFYLRFLGRASDPNGRAGWIGFLQQGGTEEQIESLFLTSPEYISHINVDYVQSLYINVLGRTASPGELATWNNNIQSLGLLAIANGFTYSPENRLNTLRSDFQMFLHRTPTDTELMPLVNTSLDLLALEGFVLSSPEFFVNG